MLDRVAQSYYGHRAAMARRARMGMARIIEILWRYYGYVAIAITLIVMESSSLIGLRVWAGSTLASSAEIEHGIEHGMTRVPRSLLGC